MRYEVLSEPFPLLPEGGTLTAHQLLAGMPPQQQGQQKKGQQPGAGAEPGVAGGGPRRYDIAVQATAAGRADCVITWVEYELAPGVWLSYAPHELQVGGSGGLARNSA